MPACTRYRSAAVPVGPAADDDARPRGLRVWQQPGRADFLLGQIVGGAVDIGMLDRLAALAADRCHQAQSDEAAERELDHGERRVDLRLPRRHPPLHGSPRPVSVRDNRMAEHRVIVQLPGDELRRACGQRQRRRRQSDQGDQGPSANACRVGCAAHTGATELVPQTPATQGWAKATSFVRKMEKL